MKKRKHSKSLRSTPAKKRTERIVKVQRSLFSNTGTSMVLIYDRTRSVQLERPLDNALAHRMHGAYKCYFWAELRGNNLILGRKVPVQYW